MGAASLRILVVDSDTDDAQKAVRALERHVGPAVAVPDAYQALARLEEERFDLVVVDVALPGASGFEFLARRDPSLPAVVVTALYSQGTIARARAAGARAVLAKPCPAPLLVAAALDLNGGPSVVGSPVAAIGGVAGVPVRSVGGTGTFPGAAAAPNAGDAGNAGGVRAVAACSSTSQSLAKSRTTGGSSGSGTPGQPSLEGARRAYSRRWATTALR
jgi:CheY-like chemotaxis protein